MACLVYPVSLILMEHNLSNKVEMHCKRCKNKEKSWVQGQKEPVAWPQAPCLADQAGPRFAPSSSDSPAHSGSDLPIRKVPGVRALSYRRVGTQTPGTRDQIFPCDPRSTADRNRSPWLAKRQTRAIENATSSVPMRARH